jgi:fatty-acid desaturase
MTGPSRSVALSGPLLSNRLNLSWMVLCHTMAIGCLVFHSWRALSIALPLTLFAAFGISIGFHRLLTHRSFRTYRWIERTLAFAGTLTVQRGPVEWVALHRMHHAHPDCAGDPYDASRGIWHSHIGWVFERPVAIFDPAIIRKYARDMARDPFMVWLGRNEILYGMQIALFGVLWLTLGPAVAFACTFGRLVVQYHATFLVNSLCHRFGYRNYDTVDSSTNLAWLAYLTIGEGWHNNHHGEPTVAINSRRWFEFDLSGQLIVLMERLGLVWDVRRHSEFSAEVARQRPPARPAKASQAAS